MSREIGVGPVAASMIDLSERAQRCALGACPRNGHPARFCCEFRRQSNGPLEAAAACLVDRTNLPNPQVRGPRFVPAG